MLPKNNARNIENAANQQSTNSGNNNQQFRQAPPVSGVPFPCNSNLVVTQQQQPNRNNNNNNINGVYPLNGTNNINPINQFEVAKRFVAAMQQPQNQSYLINHPSQSPIQVTQSQSQQAMLDQPQMIRLPQTSQSDTVNMNNIFQALYLIQQNMVPSEKNKLATNHSSDASRQIITTLNNPLVLNNTSNSLITISSSSQNQNATVLAISNSDMQLLEALGRFSSQQAPKPLNHPNVSLIQSDSLVAHQLLNALQRQSPRTSTGVNSPGFMVLGQTSKPPQVVVKDVNNTSQISSHSNGNEISNGMLQKPSSNSNSEIPWIKLFERLSGNQDNLSDINRSFTVRDFEENQRTIGNKMISQSRLASDATKYRTTEPTHRNNDIVTPGNNPNNPSKPAPNVDTHQILRDNIAISYLMPSSNNVSINNDDMVNMHFQQSLRDKMEIKKQSHHNSQFPSKSFEFANGNSDNMCGSNSLNMRKKLYGSFIDLERPEYGMKIGADCNQRTTTPNHTTSCIPTLNNKVTIKETTDAMVEKLLIQSLKSNYSVSRPNSVTQASVHTLAHGQLIPEASRSNTAVDSNRVEQSFINTHTDNVVITTCDSLINSTSALQDPYKKSLQLTNIRPNPSKNDLPLKKRIMLAFNENCDENSDDKPSVATESDSKPVINIHMEEKATKIQRKRTYTDSQNSDNKTDTQSQDSNVPLTKKRRGRIPGSGKNQKLKEESRLKEIAKINLVGNEESWHDLMKMIINPPDIDRISSKTLTLLDLNPLKLSKEQFFQIGSCIEIAPKMVKCRSCRQNNSLNNTANIESSSNNMDDVSSIKSGSKDSISMSIVSSFCRFHGFRKLQFSAKGALTQAGFCNSNEADSQDLSLWRMYHPLPSELSVSIATYLVETLSSIFCEIIDSENTFLQESQESLNDINNKSIATKTLYTNLINTTNKSDFYGFVWKRPVPGVREMCDVCDTSIFNTHWACRKCGYSVCVDCFSERYDSQNANDNVNSPIYVNKDSKQKENDCLQNRSHNNIKNSVHQNTRGANRNRIFSCDRPWAMCTANRQQHCPDQMLKVELIPIRVINELRNRMHTVARLLGIKLRCKCSSRGKVSVEMRQLKRTSLDSIPVIETENIRVGNYDLHMLADIALKEVVNADNKVIADEDSSERPRVSNAPRPPPVLSPPHHPENINYPNCNSQDTKQPDSNASTNSWLNVSSTLRILRLYNEQSLKTLQLFQQEWIQGHPVLVSGCQNAIDMSLWTPDQFIKEFESEIISLIDCETGFSVPKVAMKSFLEGFTCVSKRICSSDGTPKTVCLKVKDWPSSEDISELVSQRFKDVLSNLPIKEYTSRQGEVNLAAHLPDFFVCPDLGPKIHNAYGIPRESKLGTTNLHLDITDAVSVMLHVAIPPDEMEIEVQKCLDCLREAMVDASVLKRVEQELPGALWHVFLPKDVPRLKEFLSKVLLERGKSLTHNQDPIYDQQLYLSQDLLDRLKEESNIESCAIVQFYGDAIFIPAGSPHQIRNLHSCTRIVSDFVSPENILNCLLVTKEYRKLSSVYNNHEDRLQAKNMIFHTMKDAVSTLIVSNSQSDTNNKHKDYHLKRKRSNQTYGTSPMKNETDEERSGF